VILTNPPTVSPASVFPCYIVTRRGGPQQHQRFPQQIAPDGSPVSSAFLAAGAEPARASVRHTASPLFPPPHQRFSECAFFAIICTVDNTSCLLAERHMRARMRAVQRFPADKERRAAFHQSVLLLNPFWLRPPGARTARHPNPRAPAQNLHLSDDCRHLPAKRVWCVTPDPPPIRPRQMNPPDSCRRHREC
jgi:hypothetical protein